jgi:hypothetical protein
MSYIGALDPRTLRAGHQRECMLHDIPAVPRVLYLAVLIALISLAACSGNLHEKSGMSELDASALGMIQPPPCDNPATPTDGTGDCTGGGKPGDDCLTCHHQGGVAVTSFTFAGTLYTDTMGTSPLAGATIYVEDAVGGSASAITHANGNFYTSLGFTMYPAKAFVSLCPKVVPMVNPVDPQIGPNCNTANCHDAGLRLDIP